MKLSEEMIKYRAEHDLSMKEAAEKVGITLQTWAHAEREIQNPSRLTEKKIRMLIGEKGD